MKSNYQDLIEIYKFAKKLGVDGINFQPIILDMFYLDNNSDRSNLLWPDDYEKLKNEIRDLIKIDKDNFIVTPKKLLVSYLKYFANAKSNIQCHTSEKNLIIDRNGSFMICHQKYTIGKYDGNIDEIWNSNYSNFCKSLSKKCEGNCKYLLCNQKAS